MSAVMSKTSVGVLAGTLWATSLCLGVSPSPAKVSGSIVGQVSDGTGVPQMGATVLLYNKFDRLVERALTRENGTFGFGALAPDVYALRVTLSTFLPALRRNIVVQPGMQSLLNVSLASVFSSIQLVTVLPGENAFMSDDWKWVLRSASATRPVLRLMPDLGLDRPPAQRPGTSSPLFSDTRGMVKLSAGDEGTSFGNEPDLGTAFALATSFLGSSRLQVSGNFGYSSFSGAPATAIRTSFRPGGRDSIAPEVKLTMRQYSLPARMGGSTFAGLAGGPVLRTLSATMLDHVAFSDNLRFDYGFSLDSVTFLDRLNYFSPFGRLTYDLGGGESFELGYASGTPPAELFAQEGETDVELQQDLASLAMFPRVSLRSGVTRVQRTETWELGYRRVLGSRTVSAATYLDGVSNIAVTMTGDFDTGSTPDLLPDLFSNSWVFNAGRYRTIGYMAALTQSLGEHLDATVAYGNGGALTPGAAAGDASNPDDFRLALVTARRQTVTTRVSGTFPKSGTEFITSYQWASVDSLTPSHLYLTERLREGVGFNIRIRQPIPCFGGLPGRLVATADLRNMLAQGYIPFTTAGRRLYLMHTPRSVRGGLSFIF